MTFPLHLSKVRLYGFQKEVSDLCIQAYILGIEMGDRFPPVGVFKLNDRAYQIANLGGHKRAIAHYIAGVPLECFLVSELIEIRHSTDIKNIVIVDDASVGDIYRRRLEKDPNVRDIFPFLCFYPHPHIID